MKPGAGSRRRSGRWDSGDGWVMAGFLIALGIRTAADLTGSQTLSSGGPGQAPQPTYDRNFARRRLCRKVLRLSA